MSIRFKFRSAASYDVVEFGEQRESITVRELKAKIIRHKNLNLCQDFDLLFSDAVSGREFNDDDYQIPSGSSVIIKRVPAGTVPKATMPVDKVESFTYKDSKLRYPESGHLDDFGADLCPLPDATSASFDIGSEKTPRSNEEADLAGCRSGLQKLESDLSQVISKGTAHKAQGPVVEGHMKLERSKNLATQNTDFPLELKCYLCNKTFEDAVMIPCCQHSFCEKCIRRVLVEKGRCPKCSSSESKVKDLLPNLSLRQAIQHLIESQMLIDDSGNDLCKYAPDGESGIQAIDVSCAVKVVQRENELPHSPTATGKGSNQILSESFYDSLFRKNNTFGRSNYDGSNFARGKALNSTFPKEVKHNDRGRGGHSQNLNKETRDEHLAPVADFMGAKHPLPLVPDEADSNVKKRRDTWVEGGGGDRRFLSAGRHNKGDRTCYMCGSPDHFIRDCPVASNANPMLQKGNCPQGEGMPSYISPYWNGTTMSPFGPFGNMYSNAGLMHYNTSVAPPFAVPPYVPAMYSGLPAPRGNMGMGSLAPPFGKGAEHPPVYSQYIELQHPVKRVKLSNEHLDRGQWHSNNEDDFHHHYHFNEAARQDDYKLHRKQEPSGSYSHDSSGHRSRKRHQHEKYSDSGSLACDERHERSSHSSFARRDRKLHPPERLNWEPEHKHRNSDRHQEEERIKPPSRSLKKHHERSGQSGSDSSRNYHQSQKEVRRVEHDVRGSHHKHNSYLEPSKHDDQRSKDKERNSGHDSRQSKRSKHTSDELQGDRWQLVSRLDEDRRDYYHHRKRKAAQ